MVYMANNVLDRVKIGLQNDLIVESGSAYLTAFLVTL